MNLKPSKCCFGQKSVNYLGHVVGVEGLQPDHRKVQAAMDFPRPVDGTGVRRFGDLVITALFHTVCLLQLRCLR